MDKLNYYDIKLFLENSVKVPYCIIKFLLDNDILNKKINELAPKYTEYNIDFKPTYKISNSTGRYNLEKKNCFGKKYGRLPGYADRILFKTKFKIKNQVYDSLPIIGNDHFPVFYACKIKQFTIGVISWNIGNANQSTLNESILEKYFESFNNNIDILIVGFQESKRKMCICNNFTNFTSSVCLHGNNIKSILGHLVGFGLETCILWNDNITTVTRISNEINNGTITKGQQISRFLFEKNGCTNCNLKCTIGNIHAPFTENIKKYHAFFSRVIYDLDNIGETDITFMLGDLNSRSILKSNENPNSNLLIKNINIPKLNSLKYIFNKNLKIKRLCEKEFDYYSLKRLKNIEKINFNKKTLL